MKHTVRMLAGYVSTTHGDDYVSLEIEDVVSGIRFMDIEMSMAEFGKLVKGSGSIKLEADLIGLENIGKKYVHEPRSVFCELKPTSYKTEKDEYATWLKENCSEEGWHLNTYLGSQGSIKSVPNGHVLNYSVYKWVDISDEEREILSDSR